MTNRQTELRFFGPPTILRDDTALHVARRKAIALIAYLVLNPDGASRDKLCGLFWPDLSRSGARRVLRITLAHARELVGHECLVADRDRVSVDIATLMVDVMAFLDASEKSDDRAGPLERAASLYRGEFMAGFFLSGCPDFDAWQMSTADRMRDLQRRNLWSLARLHADDGRLTAAIASVRGVLELDPTDEDAHRELMLLCHEDGDRVAALRAYDRCRTVLAAELDTEPEAETVELYETIRSTPAEHGRRGRSGSLNTAREPETAGARESPEVRVVTIIAAGTAETTDSVREAVRDSVRSMDGELIPDFGDAVQLIFGRSTTHEDDPERAVLAALAICREAGRRGIQVPVAVRTGAAVFTAAGSSFGGPLVNLLHRQLFVTSPGHISLCERTFRRVRSRARCRAISPDDHASDRIGPIRILAEWRDHDADSVDQSIPFVGREDVLPSIAQQIAGMMRGDGGAVLVHGVAGIGKSRLVAEARSSVPNPPDDALWCAGHCTERVSHVWYQALEPVIRGIIDWLGIGGAEGTEPIVSHLVGTGKLNFVSSGNARAILDRLLGVSFRDTRAERHRVLTGADFHQAFVDTLVALAASVLEHGPLILHIEDLHWADSATASLIAELARHLSSRPFAIVATYRHDELRDREFVVRQITESFAGRVQMVSLAPLGGDATEEIVRRAASSGCDAESIRRMADRSGGNPLFAVQLAREPPGCDSPVPDARIPFDIARIIQRRLDVIDHRSRRALKAAAVAGSRFVWPVVCRAAELSPEHESDVLEAAASTGYVAVRSTVPLVSAEFVHVLFHEAIYGSITPEERRILHGRIAMAISREFEASSGAHTWELAYHYHEAEDHENAARFLVAHGDELRRRFAFNDAVLAYTSAAAHLDVVGTARERRECWLKIASCHDQDLNPLASREALAQAFGLPVERSEPAVPGPLRDRGQGVMRMLLPGAGSMGLDPFRWPNLIASVLHRQMYRPLVRYTSEGIAEPDAAARWQCSDDGLTYRFEIRDDAVWSDGAPLVAEDFGYSIVNGIRHFSTYADGIYLRVKGCEQFLRTGETDCLAISWREPKILEFELANPSPYLLHCLGVPYLAGLPTHLISRYGDSWSDLKVVASSGALHPVSTSAQHGASFARSLTYNGRFTGNLTESHLVEGSWETMLDAYEARKFDTSLLVEQHIAEAVRRFPDDIVTGPRQAMVYLMVNSQSERLSQSEARRALAHAIDRHHLVELVCGSLHYPGTGGVIPPGVLGHRPDIGLGFDPALARSLARSSGLARGGALKFMSGLPHFVEPVVTMLKDNLGLDIELLPWRDGIFGIAEEERPYDVMLMFLMILVPDPLIWLAMGAPTLGGEHEEAINRIASMGQSRERLELIRDLDRRLVHDAMRIPLYYPRGYAVSAPYVEKFALFPMYHGGAVDVSVFAH